MRVALIAEYDMIYRQSPDLWETDNSLVCRTVARYVPAPARILDVGCGNGHTLAAMREAFPGAKLYGIDISTEALNLAAARVPGVVLKQVYAEDFAPKARFDVITVIGVAEHFLDPEVGLRVIAKLLSTGGICYVLAPNNLSYSPGPHTYRRLECGSGQMEWHLARAEWEALIARAGFTIAEAGQGDSAACEFIWVLRS